MSSERMKAVREFLINAKKKGIFDGVTDNIAPEDMEWLKPAEIEQGVTFTPDNFNGVEVELATPEKLLGKCIILYIHGGAFTYGDTITSRPFASRLAKESGLCVYSLSYRLAPSNPFPAAPNDCFTVYKALLDKYPGIKIALVGDSAGANLSLVTVLMALDAGIALPSSVTLYSVVSDFATGLPSRKKFAEVDILASDDVDKEFRENYFIDNDPHNPYISPLLGNYEGFCPLKVIVDSSESLFDDSDLLVQKALEAGVEVDYQKWDDTFHAFPAYPTVASNTPESAQVIKDTAQFIKKYA